MYQPPEKLPPAPVTPEAIVGAYDPKKNSEPPVRTYASLDGAFDFFNRELFNDTLPRCLITMQRGRGMYGYFSGDRFVNLNDSSEITDEIALNPNHFQGQAVGGVLSTLVHEQAHLWQHHFGKPGRGRYHNKEWAAKMVQIGLIPSSTGEPGGKPTGDRVTITFRKADDSNKRAPRTSRAIPPPFCFRIAAFWAEAVRVSASVCARPRARRGTPAVVKSHGQDPVRA